MNQLKIKRSPEEIIINPATSAFLQMDDISVSLMQLTRITESNTNTTNSILKVQESIQQTQRALQDILANTLQLQQAMVQKQDQILEKQSITANEMQLDADTGKRLPFKASVTSTEFYIIDTQLTPGHKVKSVTINNDGENTIYVGINVAISSVGPIIEDVVKDESVFVLVKKGEHFDSTNNRRVIKNIYLLSAQDISYFRATLVW